MSISKELRQRLESEGCYYGHPSDEVPHEEASGIVNKLHADPILELNRKISKHLNNHFISELEKARTEENMEQIDLTIILNTLSDLREEIEYLRRMLERSELLDAFKHDPILKEFMKDYNKENMVKFYG